MYIPTAFREDDPVKLLAFMRAHSFATMVSWLDDAPFATHLPVSIEERGDTIVLTGHVARANAHARAFAPYTQSASLMIFSGPHAYISPVVYEARESVPTWNYIAVHATGVPQTVLHSQTPESMQTMLESMITQYDPAYHDQWRELSQKFREGMMRGVVGFEMPVATLEGKFKMSQNRSMHDQAAVEAMLSERDDESSRALAAHIRSARPRAAS